MKLLKFLAIFVAILSMTLGIPATTVMAAPGQPGATYPSNNVLLTSYFPPILFQWTSSGTLGTVYYDLEISTDATFTNFAATVGSNDGNHTASRCGAPNQAPQYSSAYAYQPSTTYYWRVQAYDNTCTGDFVTGGSGWAVFSFRTSIVPPTLVAPVNASTLANNLNNNDPNNKLFQWTGVVGASGFVLQVSYNSAFSSLIINTSLPSTQNYYTPASDLPAATLFYWRVETLNNTYGPSYWSTTWSFTTANSSPAPILSSTGNIPNGKVTNDWTPGLRWNEIALPSGSTFTSYEVQASTDSTFYDTNSQCFDVKNTTAPALSYLAFQTYNNNPNLTYAQMDTQDALANAVPGSNCPTATYGGILKFQPANQYYWHVRAIVSTGAYSDWSKVFSFKTSYPKVDSTSFSTNTDSTKLTITFSWAEVSPKPYNYTIQICHDATFAEGDCVISYSKGNIPYIWWISLKIQPGTLFYWRVRAEGPWGPGLWSNYATITTP